MKAAPIDWDALEWALTRRSDDDDPLYLDVTTGEVMSFAALDADIAAGWIWSGLTDGWLLTIAPLPSSVEQHWMHEFAAAVADLSVRRKLEGALVSSCRRERFKKVLTRHPAERERWFVLHRVRVREASREWLEENGIQVGEPPAASDRSWHRWDAP